MILVYDSANEQAKSMTQAGKSAIHETQGEGILGLLQRMLKFWGGKSSAGSQQSARATPKKPQLAVAPKKKVKQKPARPAWRKWGLVPIVLLGLAMLVLLVTNFVQPKTQVPLLNNPPPAAAEKINLAQVFVPAGEFLMGSTDAADEKPAHTVFLDAFWIGKYEVSNAEFQACVSSGLCTPPAQIQSLKHLSYYGNAQFANYPVIYVSWANAQSFCAWAGQRLPSEAEWEKAARGTDGRIYPWGNHPPAGNLVNFNDKNNGFTDTAPVDSLLAGASPYGAVNMAGNVWEWVGDWYQADYYASQQNWRNPLGPPTGTDRIIRGGSLYNSKWNLRAAGRLKYDPKSTSDVVGFRCARSDAAR